jgi:hypothetical protein
VQCIQGKNRVREERSHASLRSKLPRWDRKLANNPFLQRQIDRK